MELHAGSGTAGALETATLESEGEIHSFLEGHEGVQIGGVDTFLVNSELSTRTGVRGDLVGVAATGHIVIVELKQKGGGRKGSRTALVQALEYAADFRSRDYHEIADMYAAFGDGTPERFRQAHADYFGLTDPLREADFTMATAPRLVLLAEHFRPSDIDAARYLRDVNDVDITCVQVTPFEIDGKRFYGFEARLMSKTEPSAPSRRAREKSLPWLTMQLEEAYYTRFGQAFGLETAEQATDREGYFKGNHFVSAGHHPQTLIYSFNVGVFDGDARVKYGVSPRGHERIERIIDRHRDAIGETHGFKDTKYRRIRCSGSLQPILSDASLDTVAPEVSETVARVLWHDERFQSEWRSFLDMVERWHRIIDTELDA